MSDYDDGRNAAPQEAAVDSDKLFTLDFQKILSTILGGWLVIAAVGLAVTLLLGVYAHITSPYYTSAMVVRQKAPDPADAASSPLAKLTSGLTGGLLGATASPPYQSFTQLLTSPDLAQRLVKDHPDIMPRIFYWEWDSTKKAWYMPWSPSNAVKYALKGLLGGIVWQPPTSDDLLVFLQDYVTVSQDATTGLVTLSYADMDPKFARHLLNVMVGEADQMVREQDRIQNTQRIAYLQQELQRPMTQGEQSAVIGLLGNEYYQKMILKADRFYSIDEIQPANLAIIPSWPNPIILLAIAVVVGGLLGLLAVWLLYRRNFDFRKVQIRTYWKIRWPRFRRAGRATAAPVPTQHAAPVSAQHAQ